MSGVIGNFGQANYSAAKMGVVGLSNSIALDMARSGVTSNCIAPFAWSRMTATIPAETEAERERVERFKAMSADKIAPLAVIRLRSEEHTSALQSLMRISYAVFCLQNKNVNINPPYHTRILHTPCHYTTTTVKTY